MSAGPASLVGRSPLLTSCAGVGGGGTIGRVLLTPPPDPDDKAAWRDRLRAARRALVEAQGAAGREAQAEALASVMLTWLRGYAAAHLEGRLRGTTVTAYEQLRTEPPLDRFVEAAHAEGVRVLVPITLGLAQRRLDWHEAGDPDRVPLGPGALATVDVCFLPGLAVDRRGVRLGKGGGYYDAALPLLAPGTPRIAVLHDHELVDRLPRDTHDEPVEAVVTTAGVRWLTPRA